MTPKRVYELAVRKALDIWVAEDNFRLVHPNDELAQIRTKRAWDELLELERELKKLEDAEQ